MSCTGSETSALVVVGAVDSEVLGAHLDEQLHELGLGVLGQLGCLQDQRFDLVVGCHIPTV